MVSIVEPGTTCFNRAPNIVLSSQGERRDPAEIRVHAIPGDYEVAYVLHPGARVIARHPITIEAAQASVSAPATVTAGEAFEVSYEGDGFRGDRVVLVDAASSDDRMWSVSGNYGFFAANGGGTGTITERLTATPGAYEVRYVTGLQHQVLARAPVTITE